MTDPGECNIMLIQSDDATNAIHLLSHIYVARSEALWKETALASWFENQASLVLSELDTPAAQETRADAMAIVQTPRDPLDETQNVPLHICRHVVCSESTSWLGFLPPAIRNRPVHAFDPLPPTTSVSAYDNAYFSGVRPSGRGRGGPGGAGGGGIVDGFMERLMGAMQGEGWQERVEGIWREMTGRREFAGVAQEERNNLLQQVSLTCTVERYVARLMESYWRWVKRSEVSRCIMSKKGKNGCLAGSRVRTMREQEMREDSQR